MTKSTSPPRISLAGVILGGLVILGLVAAGIRYVYGIGAISNLSDGYSWGFWISFDLLCGVALAAGGFMVAGAVHILNLKEFRPLLRPAVLTAFLGYVMVAVALLVDLGRPERIWHMIIYWNPHSVLFEVGWCVMLYLTVLFLEFLPVLSERSRWSGALRVLHAITLPLVILGVVLSTLHQSSLGSLYLIMSTKLHALWYSPLLPLYFFLTAASVGVAMVIVESSISSRVFRRGLEVGLLGQLARVVPWLLGVYLVLKFGELAVAGEFGLLFSSGLMSGLFWLEIIVGVLAPAVLFARESVRKSASRLLTGALLLVGGVVLNRFDVSLLALAHRAGASYFPHWMEFAVTASILSAGVLVFGWVARTFPLFEAEPDETGKMAAAGTVAD